MNSRLKKQILLGVFSLLFLNLHAQTEGKTRYGVWFLPSYAKKIHGIAIGPAGSEILCDKPHSQVSNGLNIQFLGQGIFQLLFSKQNNFVESVMTERDSLAIKDTAKPSVLHNGIILSTLGTFTPQVNGIAISPFMSMSKKVNGLSLNAIWNLVFELNGLSIGCLNHVNQMNGLQLGLINKATRLSGIQVGLWNVNDKRRLPLLNWNFTRP